MLNRPLSCSHAHSSPYSSSSPRSLSSFLSRFSYFSLPPLAPSWPISNHRSFHAALSHLLLVFSSPILSRSRHRSLAILFTLSISLVLLRPLDSRPSTREWRVVLWMRIKLIRFGRDIMRTLTLPRSRVTECLNRSVSYASGLNRSQFFPLPLDSYPVFFTDRGYMDSNRAFEFSSYTLFLHIHSAVYSRYSDCDQNTRNKAKIFTSENTFINEDHQILAFTLSF